MHLLHAWLLAALASAFVRPARRRGPYTTAPQTQRRAHAWQQNLDEIDEDMWRDVRRDLYGGPDAAAPSSLSRFERYCVARRTALWEDVVELDGGRRAPARKEAGTS